MDPSRFCEDLQRVTPEGVFIRPAIQIVDVQMVDNNWEATLPVLRSWCFGVLGDSNIFVASGVMG